MKFGKPTRGSANGAQVGDKKFTNFNDVRDEIERQTDQVAGAWARDLEILPSILAFLQRNCCVSQQVTVGSSKFGSVAG